MSRKSEYMKQRKRLQNAMYRIKKRGFDVNYNLPKIPKRITEGSIRRLAAVTPESIRKKSRYVEPETGELIPYKKYKREYKRAPKQVSFSVENFRVYVAVFNEEARRIIYSWLDRTIERYGLTNTSQMLNDAYESGNIITYKEVYDKDKLLQGLSRMLSFMKDVGEIEVEDFMQAFEEEEVYFSG